VAIDIVKCTSKTNTSYYADRPIKWIFIHYTAGTTSKKGTAINTAKYFSRPIVQASADFIVDDKTIVQYNPDIKNRYTWAVGGAKYNKCTTSEGGKYYYESNNSNSISIELCSRKKNTKTLNATDTDWYFTDEVVANAEKLTKYLMHKYNIDANHVIMHHHRTGKICPNPWCVKEDRLKYYHEFIDRISGKETNAVTIADCRLYVGMNEWEGVLEKLTSGTRVEIVKDIGNGWSKVDYLSDVGYIKNTVLECNNKTELSKYPTRKTISEVALRSDRKVAKSTKVGMIPSDTLFTLLAKDKKWAYVKYNGDKYYIWKAKTTVK
jgi:N-acetylmuramoyl-L-alanine amidase CwlA